MDIVELRDRLDKEFSNLDDRYGYIGYCYDRGPDGKGTGFHHNADIGDAKVAIKRIIEAFGINLNALMAALAE